MPSSWISRCRKWMDIQATREIRKLDRPDAKTIPIVAMTANAFSEDIQQSKEVGMDAHVAKPIDIDVLCSTLEKKCCMADRE